MNAAFQQFWTLLLQPSVMGNSTKHHHLTLLRLNCEPVVLSKTKLKSTCLTNEPKSSYVNSGLQFVQRDSATVAQHLPADILTYGGGAWEKADKPVLSEMFHTGIYPVPPPPSHLPSRCSSMLVLSRFLARATSPSVTLVQRDILQWGREMPAIVKDSGFQLVESQDRLFLSFSNCNPNVFKNKTASPLTIMSSELILKSMRLFCLIK